MEDQDQIAGVPAEELKGEAEFFAAMHAYRAAKDSGDGQATQAAEDALREQVRAEIIARMGLGE
ncbi:MAG: hypothetical protein Q4A01_06675 [Coriobacteriales bacterium]|nr:hypothetical protein [Coriobacteriales bacterium]